VITLKPSHLKDTPCMFTVNALTWDPYTNQGAVVPITVCVKPQLDKNKKNPPELLILGTMGPEMKDSMQLATTLARQTLMGKYKRDVFDNHDILITMPEDPQYMYDGPSAGLATYTAVLGAMMDWDSNPNSAMTGHILEDGRVMRVGGVPKKLELAYSMGITTVFVPKDSLQDLPVTEMTLTVIGVALVNQILELAEVPYLDGGEHEIPKKPDCDA
jgi:ATP-dependent Lon protease